MNIIPSAISLSEGISSDWNTFPIPIPLGMLTYATDTQIIKRGDGVSLYVDLPVFVDIKQINETGKLVPVGTCIMWYTETPPTGYLELNGATLSRTTYSALYSVLGTMYGAPTSATFKLPDTRGVFARGWSHDTTVDPDRLTRTTRGDNATGNHIGTRQADEMRAHTHNLYGAPTSSTIKKFSTSNNGGGLMNTGIISYTGGTENRPININTMFCIKY